NTLTLSVASNIAGPLGPEAAERLAHLSPLRVLSLSGQPIGDRGVCTLVQSPHLLNLESLDLSHTGASSRAYRTLASRCALPALRHLYLRGTTPNLEALSALTQAPRMRQLEFVYLPPQLTTAKPGSEADAQLRAYRATIATAPLPERFKVASRCHNDTLDDFWTLNDFRFSAPHPNITDAIEELLRHMHPDERRTTNPEPLLTAMNAWWGTDPLRRKVVQLLAQYNVPLPDDVMHGLKPRDDTTTRPKARVHAPPPRWPRWLRSLVRK
ncbi:MAG: hypothetical protein AAFX99_35880, partial [Myxococcota bacterium]